MQVVILYSCLILLKKYEYPLYVLITDSSYLSFVCINVILIVCLDKIKTGIFMIKIFDYTPCLTDNNHSY